MVTISSFILNIEKKNINIASEVGNDHIPKPTEDRTEVMRKIDKAVGLGRFVSKQERYLLGPSHGQLISKEFSDHDLGQIF